ncbi:MAG: hypothetical protein E2O56_04790 [Gammaproteobacteria bacterium]|nr:MAG: hypothetical protein E2O56_04790 [Gammaproteobacteria bacterium]
MIEDSGTRVVGTRVSVSSVELSLGDRLVVIHDLEIANPPGFSSDPAFRIGEASAQLDPDDYRVIRKIFASDVTVQVESRGLDTNFKQLQENISNYSARSGNNSEPASGDEAMHLVIDLLEMDKAQARLVSDVLAEPLTFGINRLVMRDLSGTPEQVSYQIMQQITAAVVSAAALKVLEAQARDKGGAIMDAIEELLDDLSEDTDEQD